MSTTTTTRTTNGQRVQTLDDFVNSDVVLKDSRLEYHFQTPVLAPVLRSILKDDRDYPMLCLQLNIMELIIPGVALIYWMNLTEYPPPFCIRCMVSVAYVAALLGLFMERFILMMHFQAHRPIYNNDLLNSYVTWVMAPFFGVPTGVYKLHHVVMHHIENNHEWDISSTETYQRDSLFHFLIYYVHFAALIFGELPLYCIKAKRWEWLRAIAVGVLVWFSTIYLLSKFVSFEATFWVFMLPHAVAMGAMSFGNWSQHIFVDPKRPESNYALTYNCIDTFKNRVTFNDGYHVIHHINARLHWTELPGQFHTTLDKHLEQGALTFRGLHFFDVGILVMSGRLRELAEKHYVHLGPKDSAPSVDAVEEQLRGWLRAMPSVKPTKKEA